MSGSVNKVTLIGRLGKDPKVTTLNNSERVVTFSLATSERWVDKATGDRKEKTEWHNVVIFNDAIGKIAEKYLKKGSNLYLEGALQTRKWTDQAGVEKYTTEVVLARFRGELTLLDSAPARPAPNEGDYGTTSTRESRAGTAQNSHAVQNGMDDPIPF